MKKIQFINISLLATLIAGAGAAANAEAPKAEPIAEYGQLMTVRVENVPATTHSATFDLGDNLQGLELQRGNDNIWTGSYAVLPEMANPIFRPKVHLYDSANKPLEVGSTGTRVQMASSEFEQQDLALILEDKNTVFAFDSTIAPDSIKFKVANRVAPLRPWLDRQTFALPSDVNPESITCISARTREGEYYVYSPETGFDAASTDEQF